MRALFCGFWSAMQNERHTLHRRTETLFTRHDPLCEMLCTPAVRYGRPNIAVELLNPWLGIRKVTGHAYIDQELNCDTGVLTYGAREKGMNMCGSGRSKSIC
jgi:hypothetical protein